MGSPIVVPDLSCELGLSTGRHLTRQPLSTNRKQGLARGQKKDTARPVLSLEWRHFHQACRKAWAASQNPTVRYREEATGNV